MRKVLAFVLVAALLVPLAHAATYVFYSDQLDIESLSSGSALSNVEGTPICSASPPTELKITSHGTSVFPKVMYARSETAFAASTQISGVESVKILKTASMVTAYPPVVAAKFKGGKYISEKKQVGTTLVDTSLYAVEVKTTSALASRSASFGSDYWGVVLSIGGPAYCSQYVKVSKVADTYKITFSDNVYPGVAALKGDLESLLKSRSIAYEYDAYAGVSEVVLKPVFYTLDSSKGIVAPVAQIGRQLTTAEVLDIFCNTNGIGTTVSSSYKDYRVFLKPVSMKQLKSSAAAPSGMQNPIKEDDGLPIVGFSYSGKTPHPVWDAAVSLSFDPTDITFIVVKESGPSKVLVRNVELIEFPAGEAGIAAAQRALDALGKGTDAKREVSFTAPVTVNVQQSLKGHSSCAPPAPSFGVAVSEQLAISLTGLPSKSSFEVKVRHSPGIYYESDVDNMLALASKAGVGNAKTAILNYLDASGLNDIGKRETTRRDLAEVPLTVSMRELPEFAGSTYLDEEVTGNCRMPPKRYELSLKGTASGSLTIRIPFAVAALWFGKPDFYEFQVTVDGEPLGTQTAYLNFPDPSKAVAKAVKDAGLRLGTLLPVQYLAKNGEQTKTNYASAKPSFTLGMSNDNYYLGGGITGKVPFGTVFTSSSDAFALAEATCFPYLAAPSCSCEGDDVCRLVLVLPKKAS